MRTGEFLELAVKSLLQYKTKVGNETLLAFTEEELEYEFDDDDHNF